MNSQVLVDRDLLQELASFCSDSRSYNETMRVLAASAPIPDAGNVAEHLPDSAFQDEFQVWWEEEGQYVRSGGGAYERTFAFQAWRHLMPKLVSALQASAMVVPDGWRLVPVEATKAIRNAINLLCDDLEAFDDSDAFRRYLLAASTAPGDK